MGSDGPTSSGLTHRSGLRNLRNKCDSQFHLAPKCPRCDAPRSEFGPLSPANGEDRRPSCRTVSMETPASAQNVIESGEEETSGEGG